MTQPRKLHELYQLLWEHIENCDIFCLCGRIEYLYNNKKISFPESLIMQDYLKQYKPKRIKGVYWWALTKKGITYRKQLVQRMIEETKNN